MLDFLEIKRSASRAPIFAQDCSLGSHFSDRSSTKNEVWALII